MLKKLNPGCPEQRPLVIKRPDGPFFMRTNSTPGGIGVDAAFEIRALLCSAEGPNLRNGVVHGLLDDEDFYSEPVA